MPHTFPSSTSPSGAYVSAVTPPTSLSVMHATTSSSANNNNNPPSTTTSSSTPPPPSTTTPTPSSNNNNTNTNNNPSANVSPTIATSPSYSTSNLSLNSTLGHASSPPSHHHHHSHHQHPIQQQQQSSLHHSPYPQQTPPISPIHQTSPNQNNTNLATTTTSSSMGSPLLGGLSSSSSHPLHHLQHHHQQQQPQQYSGNNSPYHYPQYPSPQHHQQQPPLQPHQSSQQQIQLQLQQHQQILFEHNNNTSGSSSNGSHKQLALHPTNNNNPDSNSSDAGDYPYGISGMLVGSATAIGGVVAIGRGGDGGGSSRDHLLSASNTNKQSASMLSSSRKRGRFSPDEDQKILVGVTKFYDDKKKNVDWDKLIKWSELGRTKDQVKNRYTRLSRKPINIPSMSSASDLMDNLGYMSPVHAVEYDDHAPSIVHSGVAPAPAAASHQHALPSSNNNSNNNNTNEEPALKKQKTIHDYVSVQPVPKLQTQPPTPRTPTSSVQPGASMFGTVQESPIESMGVKSEPISTSLTNSAMLSDVGATSGAAQVNKMNGNTNGTMNGTTETSNTGSASNIGKKVVSASDQQQRDLIQQLYKQIEEKDKKIVSCEKKIKDYDQKFIQLIEEQKVLDTTRTERYCNSLIEVLTKLAEQERKDDKDRMNQNSIRIGTITYQKTIGDAFEVWQDGEMFIDLERRQAQVTAEKERLEKMKKQLQKQRANVKKGSSESQQSSTSSSSSVASASTSALQALMPAPSAPSSSTSSISSISQNDILINDINEQEEILKLRLNQIKKDETIITAEREKLLISKSIQIREIKRIRDQERSRFKNPTLIQKRYFLMKLLGRGGFSEVYKAYDLIECRIVACKIHQINANWKENRKENYIKHVLRECQIHKSVKHPRLIQMFDTFILDNNTFVTVLEFCDGYDLDLYIKKHQKIPEKEAKNIIAQVFSGLAYLNQQKNKIIHFDLKPANILFMDGQIKITDFGLSKIMEEEESIELTSQGAGTYWYLPPECFEQGNTPKISPKVDVWSAGVVLYQMLFGKKPFGNDLSQQKILSEKTIINARTIVFPPKPVISEECKDFIRKCLTYNPSERPDVLTIYNDKYLRSTKTK